MRKSPRLVAVSLRFHLPLSSDCIYAVIVKKFYKKIKKNKGEYLPTLKKTKQTPKTESKKHKNKHSNSQTEKTKYVLFQFILTDTYFNYDSMKDIKKEMFRFQTNTQRVPHTQVEIFFCQKKWPTNWRYSYTLSDSLSLFESVLRIIHPSVLL